MEVLDAGHYSFTISCLTGTGLGDARRLRRGERYSDGAPFAFTPAEEVWDVVDGYSVALFGRYLKGIQAYDETLAENVAPEIVELRSGPAAGEGARDRGFAGEPLSDSRAAIMRAGERGEHRRARDAHAGSHPGPEPRELRDPERVRDQEPSDGTRIGVPSAATSRRRRRPRRDLPPSR